MSFSSICTHLSGTTITLLFHPVYIFCCRVLVVVLLGVFFWVFVNEKRKAMNTTLYEYRIFSSIWILIL